MSKIEKLQIITRKKCKIEENNKITNKQPPQKLPKMKKMTKNTKKNANLRF